MDDFLKLKNLDDDIETLRNGRKAHRLAHESENDDSYLKKCEKWFRENSLYLEPDAREAFF